MSNAAATETPNVVVSNPIVRKTMGVVISSAAVIVPAAIVLDVNTPLVDWSAWTTPAMAVTSFLAGVFGLVVTTPNVPRVTAASSADAAVAGLAALTPAERDADIQAAWARQNIG